MSGFQEILLIAAVFLAILFVPRLVGRPTETQPPRRIARPRIPVLSGRLRLAIVLSVLWPLAAAAYFEPWQRDLRLFLFVGFGPVVVSWGCGWVIRGFRRNRRRS